MTNVFFWKIFFVMLNLSIWPIRAHVPTYFVSKEQIIACKKKLQRQMVVNYRIRTGLGVAAGLATVGVCALSVAMLTGYRLLVDTAEGKQQRYLPFAPPSDEQDVSQHALINWFAELKRKKIEYRRNQSWARWGFDRCKEFAYVSLQQGVAMLFFSGMLKVSGAWRDCVNSWRYHFGIIFHPWSTAWFVNNRLHFDLLLGRMSTDAIALEATESIERRALLAKHLLLTWELFCKEVEHMLALCSIVTEQTKKKNSAIGHQMELVFEHIMRQMHYFSYQFEQCLISDKQFVNWAVTTKTVIQEDIERLIELEALISAC